VRFNVDHVQAWLDKNGGALITGGGRVVLIAVLALLLRAALHRVVRRLIRTATDGSVPVLLRPLRERARGTRFEPSPLLTERRRQRAETLGSVLRSMASFGVAFIAGLMVLSQVGLDLTPIVASAGIIGVAVGFGAQNLVKDFLTGMFMLLEDQYGVGDVIDTGEAIGTVEDVTLRVTRLRDPSGIVWYIRNGEIVRIGNRSQGWSTAVVDIPVGYSENLDVVLPLIREVVHELDASEDWSTRLLEEPVVAGVESIVGGVVTVRIIAKCAPNESFPVSREIRERVKAAFDQAGIRAPVMPPYAGGLGAPHA
jgi:small-conductance mechanosensitive channel